MKALIKRRPSFPIGTEFLSLWRIERILYCRDQFECYFVKKNKEIAVGVVMRCNDEAEYEQYRQVHLSWWALQGKDQLTILEDGMKMSNELYLFLAVVSCGKTIVLDDLLLNQRQAESLMLDLTAKCRIAISQKLYLMIDAGAVVVSGNNDNYSAIPFFVFASKTIDKKTEEDCIKSIAEFIYPLITGISINELLLKAEIKKQGIPSASRWNKDIDKHFSILLNLCLDKADPKKITSLSMLESQLRFASMDSEDIRIQNNSDRLKSPDNTNIGPESTHGLEKVAGMSELKMLLKEEVIGPIRNPEPFKRYGIPIPNGILLYGPPGCGKTYIARQLAEELGWYFKEVKGSDIGSTFVHGTVLAIGDLFADSEEHAPAMIFIDEFEGLVPKRSELSGIQHHTSAEVNEFLVNLNECASKGIFIIAATNEPNKIDDAVKRPGRLDKMIYVGPPDIEARIELLKMYLSHRPIGNIDFHNFAKLLDGYSCSDIQNITNEAARLALKENKPINSEHLSEAIRRNPSSLSLDILSMYKDFQQRGI